MNKESCNEKVSLLCKAAKDGCAEAVQSLITSEKDLNLISDEGDHYLAIASALGRTAFVQAACQHAVNHDWQFDFSGLLLDPFLVAIDAGEFTCFQWLLNYLPVSDFNRFYHRCILNNEFNPIFLMLLAHEPDLEKRKFVLNGALLRAIENDAPRRHHWVALLLELGANPHYSSQEGGLTVSPFMCAVRALKSIKRVESNRGVFNALFKALNCPVLLRKFDVYYRSIEEFYLDPKEGTSRVVQASYLQWAAANRHPELIDAIYNSMMQYQYSPQESGEQSAAELSMALDFPGDIASPLLNDPRHPLLEPSLYNQPGRTMLMMLAENNQHQLIQLIFPLLGQRDFEAVDAQRESPIMMACRRGHREVFEALNSKYTGQVNEVGDSILHILCQNSDFDMIMMSLENPKLMSLVHVQNKAGFNPILCASHKFQLKLLLSKHGKLWETSLLFVLASTFAQNIIELLPDVTLKNALDSLWQSHVISRQISILDKIAYYCRLLLSNADFKPGGSLGALFQSIQASSVIREGLKLDSKPLETAETMMLFCRQIVQRLEVLLGLPPVLSSCPSIPADDQPSENRSTESASIARNNH